mmetsp:Transcript_25682/g.31637  ORF Transcript_25682/g.31637 Transcript_25682/m.31637 type:complete len:411 (+) Transcript_25682:65-1297(+)
MSSILIDGSIGGGQVVRNAITYACILRKHVKIHSIRAGRAKPGLRAQHRTGLLLARDICGGRLKGAEIGSDCVEYEPSTFDQETTCSSDDSKDGSSFHAAIGTAGSLCLLLQIGFPCVLLSNWFSSRVSMKLEGGTNADLAPQIDYMEHVFLPIIADQSLKQSQFSDHFAKLNVIRRGYYPIGKGVVDFSVLPWFQRSHEPLNHVILLERGNVISISINSFYSGKVPRSVAEAMTHSALDLILQNRPQLEELTKVIPTVNIVEHTAAVGSGSGIIIVAKTSTNCIFGGSALGNKRTNPGITGKNAAQELINALISGGCVDDWLQDQLILFMCLAQGESKILTGSLTLHTRSAIEVASMMTNAKFEVKKVDDNSFTEETCSSSNEVYGSVGRMKGKHLISCKGIGLSPSLK